MCMAPNQWTASWHDAGVEAMTEIWGRDVEVLAWARTQPAAEKLIFDWRLETYVRLPGTGAVQVGSMWGTRDAS